MAAVTAGNTALTEPTNAMYSEKEKTDLSEHSASPPYIFSGKDVCFEELLYQAAIQRSREKAQTADAGTALTEAHVDEKKNWFHSLSDHKGPNVNVVAAPYDEKSSNDSDAELSITELERMNASRALRRASWAMVFYIITTDILGPFNAPYAISQVGWVPGVILYTFMGIIALYTGLILWRLFIRLDSLRYPIRTYADLADVLFGSWARHICTSLQTLQLVVNVATLCLSNGQALSQVTRGHLCFAVAIVIWPFVGMVIGQIRTLKNYGWLANGAVWINLLIIFISMGFIAHSPPNYAAALSSLGVPQGPVATHTFTTLPLYSKVNGIMNMVFAYGGAMIFPEILAEMRRPMDFWKGMTCAQLLIYSAYLLYGCFVYAFQGQFTLPLAFQGVSKYGWQTVGNIMNIVTGMIAAGLYGNIGLKVLYINIVQGWFNGPSLMTAKGRLIWTPLAIVYWCLAFVIASAIPQIQNISGLIAAICIMQFTYSFPPILRLSYDVITDAMAADKPYVHGQGTANRVDSWKQWSRWKRGLFSGRWYFKLFNLVVFLGGIAMACLGMWGAGESIRGGFENTAAATSFGCKSPV